MASSTQHPPHHDHDQHDHAHHDHGHHHKPRSPHRPTNQASLPQPDRPAASLLALSLSARLILVALLLALVWVLLLGAMR